MIHPHSFPVIALFSIVIHLLFFVPSTYGAPTTTTNLSSRLTSGDHTSNAYHDALAPRGHYIIVKDDQGNIQALEPITQTAIPQGTATDGAGSGFDAPAILWIAYSFVLGVPMMFMGLCMGRVATGVGVGLTASLLSWTSIINSLSASSLNDLVVVLVVIGFCILGFILGALRFGMHIGMVLLCITGGLSVGMRLIIIKQGLLVSGTDPTGYVGDWVIVGLLGLAAGILSIWKRTQMWAVAFGCSAIGSFFLVLGLDLVINKQSGMSRGLRFFFDRNSSHIIDILTTGYKPPIITQILLGISFGLIPLCTYAQHRFFRSPFLPRDESRPDPTMGNDLEPSLPSDDDVSSQEFVEKVSLGSRKDSDKSGRIAGLFKCDPKDDSSTENLSEEHGGGDEKQRKKGKGGVRKSTATIATFLDHTKDS